MRKNPRRILSPQRLPFRHPGNLQKTNRLVNLSRSSQAAPVPLECYLPEIYFHPPHSIEGEVGRKVRIPHGHV
jgi:hypothetical protein